MGIQIGSIALDAPVILAPMSGVTDRPFRDVAKRLGAGLVVSEMIASREMLRAAKASRRAAVDDCASEFRGGPDRRAQGAATEVMAEAAKLRSCRRGQRSSDINSAAPRSRR